MRCRCAARALAVGLLADLLAAGTAPAAFERLPTAPEAAALGGILALSPDPVFGNPAAVHARTGRSLTLQIWGSRPFGLPELAEAQAAASGDGPNGSAGVGFRRFGSVAYHESELRVSGSWRPSAGVGLGLVVRGLSVEGEGLEAHRSVAVDAGIRARPDPETEMGVFVETALGEIPGEDGGRQRRTAIGVTRRLGPAVDAYLEIQRQEKRQVSGILGMVWRPLRLLSVRGGIREDPFSVAWGFAVHVQGLEVMASVTDVEPLGSTVRVGIAWSSAAPERPAAPDTI